MPDAWPEPEAVDALYERLHAGGRVAHSAFLTAVLDPLAAHLRRRFPRADDHTRLTAAEDAVLSLIRNPAIYDPVKRGLIAFLCMAAGCDLLNELAKENKHRDGRENRDCVELPADDGNTDADDLPSFDDPGLAAEIVSFTTLERAVFELMRDGIRATAAFAAVLGLEHLPPEEQARAVKRVKDRLIQRLKRAGRTT